MLVTKSLGIVLVGISAALITQGAPLASVDDAIKAIALYNDTRANVLSTAAVNIDKALNTSYDFLGPLLESIPQRLPIDSALSAIAALEEKAASLGVDISICITDNYFENLQLNRILSLTYEIRDGFKTYADRLKSMIDYYAPSSTRYSIDDCVEMEFIENACLMELILLVQMDLATLKALANSPYANTENISTGLNSQLIKIVEEDQGYFNVTLEVDLYEITECAEDIFNQ